MKYRRVGRKASGIVCEGLTRADINKFFHKINKTHFKAWKGTLKKSMINISRKTKKTVPVSKKSRRAKQGGRPGDFKRSIKWKVGRKILVGWVYSSLHDNTTKRGYIGHLIEYGTRSKKQKKGKYFEPAREAEIPVLLRNIKAVCDKIRTGKDLLP